MIVHLDADAFFASVEQASDPKLRRRPVAVGGSRRGVIASASYEARRLGVRTAMPTARAKSLCPGLVVIPGDFEKYEMFSRLMFSYAYDHTPVVEVSSIDEGYFDLRGNRRRSAVEIAEVIRAAIRQSLKIPVSEGVASNKLVSAVASKLNKPSAFVEVPAGGEREFLAPLENKWLPGVGPKLSQELTRAGLVRIGQIAATSPRDLSLFAGSRARGLWEFACGVDERPVVPEAPAAKSYSVQETFEKDVTDEAWIVAKLLSLADGLLATVRREGKTIRTVEVRVRYNDFDESRRSESLPEPTDLEHDVYPVIRRLLRKAWERRVSLRLVSVKLSGVYAAVFQEGFSFCGGGPDRAERRRLAGVVDRIRATHGGLACMRGHDLLLRQPPVPVAPQVLKRAAKREWVPLNFKSGFSFLDSLLKPADIVRLAAERGHKAVAMTDPNLHGAVEFYQAAREAGIRPIVAATLDVGASRVCAYVKDRTGYANLCALLSLPGISREALEERKAGLLLRPYNHQPAIRYEGPGDRAAYGILSSIRTLTLLDEAVPEKAAGDFHFPTACASDVARDSLAIAEECGFEFELGGLKFPRFQPPDGTSPSAFLRRLAMEGAVRRYGRPSREILAQLGEELAIIAEVGYEEYFLLTWDVLWNDCHPRGIEWITRGSAADSLVCYCLGISDVCPVRFELYFRRFLNRDRMALNKLPDIDLDFPHDRKDDVTDLVFAKYGAHAAMVGGFNTFRGRSAFADIAKVLGVSESQVRRMTDHMPWSEASEIADAVASSVECRNPLWEEDPYRTALRLARHLDGMPRHPKMHPCGMVLSREPIETLSPVFMSASGRPTTHFDMEAVESIGLVKMDLLAQGGLAVMRDTRELLERKGVSVDLRSLEPWKDPEIWDMISTGGSRGVHHIESPAMLSLAKMVGVRNVDDLIAIVSVIRPGAANSQKKQLFARRARGVEPPAYAHPSLEPCLRSTYGIIAYEEHILQICEAFAGLPAGRADILRRALVKGRGEKVAEMRGEFFAAAEALGRSVQATQEVWELVSGFQGYAFCRAHSTAYGIEAYQAAHLKRYHPQEFLACVLTHGKGFYNRLVYSLECRRLGISFLLPDVNVSGDRYLPEGGALRVPLWQIKGLSRRTLDRWAAGRPFRSLQDFLLRTRASSDEMDALIRAGAFDGFGDPRTVQYWQFREASHWVDDEGQGSLFARDVMVGGRLARQGDGGILTGGTPGPHFGDMLQSGEVPLQEPTRLDLLRGEQELLGFTVSGHPLELFPDVAWDTYCPIQRLPDFPGSVVTVAGLIVEDRIHHQVDGRAMKFLSLCDWTGILECEMFAASYRRFGLETIRHPVVEVSGTVTPAENGKGFSLEVKSVQKARRGPGGSVA